MELVYSSHYSSCCLVNLETLSNNPYSKVLVETKSQVYQHFLYLNINVLPIFQVDIRKDDIPNILDN